MLCSSYLYSNTHTVLRYYLKFFNNLKIMKNTKCSSSELHIEILIKHKNNIFQINLPHPNEVHDYLLNIFCLPLSHEPQFIL